MNEGEYSRINPPASLRRLLDSRFDRRAVCVIDAFWRDIGAVDWEARDDCPQGGSNAVMRQVARAAVALRQLGDLSGQGRKVSRQ